MVSSLPFYISEPTPSIEHLNPGPRRKFCLFFICNVSTLPTMDLSKYPLEKVFYFVAGIIPGFTALLIFQLAVPEAFTWFFTLGFIGYKTKLALILLVAFVIGNSTTSFLRGTLGMIGGVIAAVVMRRPYVPPQTQTIAPWRDPRWRTVLKKQLGAQVPNDTRLINEDFFNQRREMINLQPEPQRAAALHTLSQERLLTQIDDGDWQQWYDHYHRIVLSDPERDFQWYVAHGLAYNLETAAVYVVLSAFVVPAVRHWWSLGPALFWVLILFSQEYTVARCYFDPCYLDRRNREVAS